MSLLERTRQIVPTTLPGTGGPWQRVLTAAGFGAVAAFALALGLVIPAVAAWVTDAQSTTSWYDALAFAPTLWVLAHRGSVSVPGDDVALTAPLLAVTIIAILLARGAAKAALVRVDEPDDGEPWWHVPAAYVGGYAIAGAVLALLAWVGPTRPNPIYVLPGAAIVAALGMLWALLRADRAAGPSAAPARAVLDGLSERLPVAILRALRPAAIGALVMLALGAVLVLLAVALSWSRVSQVAGELGVGASGATLLWVAQASALPNMAAWSAGWLSGAPVDIGAVSIGHAAISPGVLPMVPVLGALPEAGAGPAWAPFVPVVPAIVGGFVGWLALRQLTSLAAFDVKLRTAATAGALCAVIVSAVGFLGSMGISGGSLSYVGPHLLTLPLLLLEVVLGAVLTAAALHVVRTRPA